MKNSARARATTWREGDAPFLDKRRQTAALTLVSIALFGTMACYQLRLLRRLSDPPLPFLDAEKVIGSADAYALLETPDAVLAVGSYAATLGLAAIGPADRSQTAPALPLVLAAKAITDALIAAAYTCRAWMRFRAFSSYSLVAVAATFLTIPAVLPEARAAWRRLSRRR
jgi:hypothetical protein